MEMIELYKWSPKTEKVKTVKGEINYIDWLIKEKKRINLDSKRTTEIRERNIENRICQFGIQMAEGHACNEVKTEYCFSVLCQPDETHPPQSFQNGL